MLRMTSLLVVAVSLLLSGASCGKQPGGEPGGNPGGNPGTDARLASFNIRFATEDDTGVKA